MYINVTRNHILHFFARTQEYKNTRIRLFYPSIYCQFFILFTYIIYSDGDYSTAQGNAGTMTIKLLNSECTVLCKPVDGKMGCKDSLQVGI